MVHVDVARYDTASFIVMARKASTLFKLVLYSPQNSEWKLSTQPCVVSWMLPASSLRERAGESQCERGCEHE